MNILAGHGAGARYCGYCGKVLAADHSHCRQLAELEPPRYCAACRRRMVVQVSPTSWVARCSVHGELTDQTSAGT